LLSLWFGKQETIWYLIMSVSLQEKHVLVVAKFPH
jgi:hypothetical protein